MRAQLRERRSSDATVELVVTLAPSRSPLRVVYRTPTGALARIDGEIAGAFDREHDEILVPPAAQTRELRLEVERRSLPSTGLPPGPGMRWWWIQRRAGAAIARTALIEPAKTPLAAYDRACGDLALWGHSHLDVAWLWTYAQARRKALRTFANALALLERDAEFVFVQSQPQLFAFVREEDPALYERIAAQVRAGRIDAAVAALWVEPDCNLPSGESLLRHMLAAHRFCRDEFGIEPSIAWLPDTFGFPRTLPTVLAHAGIGSFATTKLHWNDTTALPFEQFRWRGPDGSEVIAASMRAMEGDCTPKRAAIARARREPLVVGYGDGGGGPTRAHLRRAPEFGHWEPTSRWFARLALQREALPVYDDELYLEYHRGVYTTHHDVKAANAALERRLRVIEERAAWCVAVGAPAEAIARVRSLLSQAWEIVLRNQFHDVLPGTSIAPVYEDARREHALANERLDAADATARALLPRAARPLAEPASIAPRASGDRYVFENEWLQASVLPSGTIVDLRLADGPNLVAQANLLALYRDRPKRWEAWNLDPGYERSRRAARPGAARVVDGGLEIPFDAGARSRATLRVSLRAGEPFVRAELAVDWLERRRLLRVENWLAVETDAVTYGAPHGTVTRSARTDTPQRRARFEVPGQRFAALWNDRGEGLALLALDTYGWNARALGRGGVRVGHSLLRATTWPDPTADRGTQSLAWAYAPLATPALGTLEAVWRRYAGLTDVALFRSDDPAVAVEACKPAEDGDGIVVRVRECDAGAREMRLRCGARMKAVEPVDALERPCAGRARIDGDAIEAPIGAFALRSFRVRF